MAINNLLHAEIFSLIILPLLILISRVLDVTLGTLRIMFVSRGNRLLAPILGFFEILIWLIAVRQIMTNLENIICYIAYAGGFSIGTFLGIVIEQHLAYGKVIMRIITRVDSNKLVKQLRARAFGVTVIDAEGSNGRVQVLYSIIERGHLDKITKIINKYNPNAFYTLEDVRFVKEGIFPPTKNILKKIFKSPKIYRRVRIYRRMTLQRKSK